MTHNKVSFNLSVSDRETGSVMCAFNVTPPPRLLNNSKTYFNLKHHCNASCNAFSCNKGLQITKTLHRNIAFSCHQRAHRLADQLHRCAHPCHGMMTPKDGHILLPTSFVGVSLFLGHSLKNHTLGKTYEPFSGDKSLMACSLTLKKED